MKVVYVGGDPCPFCQAVMADSTYLWRPTTLVIGRVYTVASAKKYTCPLNPTLTTIAYRLARHEYLGGDWKHCSCEFREIEGDAEEWRKIFANHKHRVKELA